MPCPVPWPRLEEQVALRCLTAEPVFPCTILYSSRQGGLLTSSPLRLLSKHLWTPNVLKNLRSRLYGSVNSLLPQDTNSDFSCFCL